MRNRSHSGIRAKQKRPNSLCKTLVKTQCRHFAFRLKSPEKLQQQLKSSLVIVKFLIDVRISNVLSMIVFFCNTVSLKHVRAVTRLSGQLTQRNGVMSTVKVKIDL